MPQVPLHAFDSGAEKASGWQDNVRQAKPEAIQQEDAFLQDKGEVNQAQVHRVAELQMPVDNSADVNTGTGVDLRLTRHPPDHESAPTRIKFDSALTTAAKYRRKPVDLNSAQKMGLWGSYTEAEYDQTTELRRDEEALEFGAPRRGVDFPPPESVPHPAELPGSANSFFGPRNENLVTNDLEQLVVKNPEATRMLLDKGTFASAYRGLQTYPARYRATLMP
jgi:hypothetical protein